MYFPHSISYGFIFLLNLSTCVFVCVGKCMYVQTPKETEVSGPRGAGVAGSREPTDIVNQALAVWKSSAYS